MRRLKLGELNVTLTGGTDREGGGDGPVVVLMHGFGAPGDDLVGLYRVLPVPRAVRFAFPEAPLAPPEFAAFGGRAWWPIDIEAMQRAQLEGRARDRSQETPAGLAPARAQLIEALDALERELNVSGERVILGGFSQGSMLALDVALRTERPLAGLVLLSTTLLCKSEWQPLMAARKRLPVLQTHGLRDPLLSHTHALELRDLLSAAGLRVEWLQFPGAHEIPDGALEALSRFIRANCGVE